MGNNVSKIDHGFNSIVGYPDGKQEERYIREIIYGKRGKVRYWEIKTEEEKEEEKDGWFVMTRIPDIKYIFQTSLYLIPGI
ncbi:MAG: hypothetical protein ACK58N_01260 [Synechocystis sp.]